MEWFDRLSLELNVDKVGREDVSQWRGGRIQAFKDHWQLSPRGSELEAEIIARGEQGRVEDRVIGRQNVTE